MFHLYSFGNSGNEIFTKGGKVLRYTDSLIPRQFPEKLYLTWLRPTKAELYWLYKVLHSLFISLRHIWFSSGLLSCLLVKLLKAEYTYTI